MYFSTLILTAGLSLAGMTDSLRVAVVTADRSVTVSRIDTVSLPTNPAYGTADVLHSITGLQINDNGGVSGLKTVSIRGMGSTHTQVTIDGVRVSNSQNGQIDFGTLATESFDAMGVDYVNSAVNLITKRPTFAEGKNLNGRISMTHGDFRTIAPSMKLNASIMPGVAASIYGSMLRQNDFRTGMIDGTAILRDNSDVRRYRAGADVFGDMHDNRGDWHLKVNVNDMERGCPGSMSWSSDDRQKDRNAFIQGGMRINSTDIYSYRINAKMSADRMEYVSGDNTDVYIQKELMASTEQMWDIYGPLVLKADALAQYDRLDAGLYDAARLETEAKAALLMSTRKLKAEASLRWMGVFDKGGEKRNCAMPLLSARYLVSDAVEIFASARRSYRVPTFNDLYYKDDFYIPSQDLKPEDAWMSESGVRYSGVAGMWRFSASADLYYNHLSEKIVYVSDPQTWMGTMKNLEKAETYGIDAMAGAVYEAKRWSTGLSVRYTLQDGTVIPYQPGNKASCNCFFSFNGWKADLNMLWHGSADDSYGSLMPSWMTADACVSKSWKRISVSLTVKNLTDKYYETISEYPMPGYMVLESLTFKF